MFIRLFSLALLLGVSSVSQAARVCQDSSTDFDGDGWGWEYGASCMVSRASTSGVCSSSASDPDGDGWGWERGASCRVAARVNSGGGSSSSVPTCSGSAIDWDGDGWAFENGRSCRSSSNGGSDNSTNNNGGSTGTTPVGVQFNKSTLRRQGGQGDNWCQTWAADDSIITAMDDGDWLASYGFKYHSRLYKIWGGPNGFSRTDIPGYPSYHVDGDGWFAYGIVSVNGVLYSTVSKTQSGSWADGPFRGMKLLRSYDNGGSWFRVDRNNNDRYLGPWDIARESLDYNEMFFYQESGRYGKGKTAYPFSFAAFVQNGKDNQASKDGYVYVYSPEGANSHQLLLARVPENQVGQRSAWQYFSGWSNGTARWSSNIEDRRANITLPERNSRGEYFGWYSWLPSVVWNPGLQKYIMVNGGTYGGNGMSNSSNDYYSKWMHTKTGSLGFWHSDTPYGPWKQFYYNDYWTVDDSKNLTYQPKLSPKWMSSDGRKMTLIWSDAMRNANGNSHSINYKWNQMEINIQTQ